MRSTVQQRFVDAEIHEALIRAGLAYDNPIRQMLNEGAEIVGPPGEGYLRVTDQSGGLVSVDHRIKELRADPNFRSCFPEAPKIARGNEDQIRQNFDRIARGDVEVVR
jgi:hypothetical protein